MVAVTVVAGAVPGSVDGDAVVVAALVTEVAGAVDADGLVCVRELLLHDTATTAHAVRTATIRAARAHMLFTG